MWALAYQGQRGSFHQPRTYWKAFTVLRTPRLKDTSRNCNIYLQGFYWNSKVATICDALILDRKVRAISVHPAVLLKLMTSSTRRRALLKWKVALLYNCMTLHFKLHLKPRWESALVKQYPALAFPGKRPFSPIANTIAILFKILIVQSYSLQIYTGSAICLCTLKQKSLRV